MTIEIKNSALVLIDLQEKLSPLIDNSHDVISNCTWLCNLSSKLNVASLISEQYPKGLGQTIHSIRDKFPASAIIEKIHFSAARNIVFVDKLASLNKSKIILCGIEAHVCVLQTALDLVKMDYQVYVVADAIGSRNPNDKQVALSRMQYNGVNIVTKEMVCFEWLEKAGTDLFKAISNEYLK